MPLSCFLVEVAILFCFASRPLQISFVFYDAGLGWRVFIERYSFPGYLTNRSYSILHTSCLHDQKCDCHHIDSSLNSLFSCLCFSCLCFSCCAKTC
uniref:Putative secreted protein n=1 Tax=Ixodes ricinus TaxID=34613 RepID=A0A6B0U3U1_IXORI